MAQLQATSDTAFDISVHAFESQFGKIPFPDMLHAPGQWRRHAKAWLNSPAGFHALQRVKEQWRKDNGVEDIDFKEHLRKLYPVPGDPRAGAHDDGGGADDWSDDGGGAPTYDDDDD